MREIDDEACRGVARRCGQTEIEVYSETGIRDGRRRRKQESKIKYSPDKKHLLRVIDDSFENIRIHAFLIYSRAFGRRVYNEIGI